MSCFKGIASFLVALSLFCLVSESAEARCRKRCRPHRSHHHCCVQTCHYQAAPAACGCGMAGYESSGTYDEQQVQKIDSSQMDNQSYSNEPAVNQSANDQVPAPPTAANSAPPAPPRAESAPANYQGDNPNEAGDQRSAADVEQTPGQNSDQSLAPDSSDVPLRPGSTN